MKKNCTSYWNCPNRSESSCPLTMARDMSQSLHFSSIILVSKHFNCFSSYHWASKWNDHPQFMSFQNFLNLFIYIFNPWEFYPRLKLAVGSDNNFFLSCKDQCNSSKPLFSMWVIRQGSSNLWLHSLNMRSSWLLQRRRDSWQLAHWLFCLGQEMTLHFCPKPIGQNWSISPAESFKKCRETGEMFHESQPVAF